MEKFSPEEMRSLHGDETRLGLLLGMPPPARRVLLPLAGTIPREGLRLAVKAAVQAERHGLPEPRVVEEAMRAARRPLPKNSPGFDQGARPGPWRP